MSQIFFMFFLFCVVLLRALYMRKQAFVMLPSEACTTIGGWMLIVCILIYPLFADQAYEVIIFLSENPYFLFLGLLKGCGFWLMTYAGQTVRKTSCSSAGFFGFICIGLIAVGNGIFGEELSLWQWFSVVLLSLTGVYFAFKGHLSTQTPYVQLMFLLMILVGCMFGLIDHYFLSHAHWYGLLLLSAIGTLIVSFTFGRFTLKKAVSCVFGRQTIKLGILFGLSELIILSILVTHVPVTLAWVAMTLAAPVMMVVSSVFWGEGRWQEQLFVGSISYAAAIPIVVGL